LLICYAAVDLSSHEGDDACVLEKQIRIGVSERHVVVEEMDAGDAAFARREGLLEAGSAWPVRAAEALSMAAVCRVAFATPHFAQDNKKPAGAGLLFLPDQPDRLIHKCLVPRRGLELNN
jgi:hypothetical protein